jgi:hypothetical protein
MPRQRPIPWRKLGDSYSWQLYSPKTRALLIWNRLRLKHNLGFKSLFPGQPQFIETSDFEWLVVWERALLSEEPLWSVIEKLHSFSSSFAEKGRKDHIERSKCELETFSLLTQKLVYDTELKPHLGFITQTVKGSYVSSCLLCRVTHPTHANSESSTSCSEPEPCRSDCSLCVTADTASSGSPSHSVEPDTISGIRHFAAINHEC